MARAKVEENAEVEETETGTEEKVDVNDPDFIAKVAAAVKDFLKGEPEVEAEELEETGTKKRPTARDEEEHTNSLVRKAVKEFLASADDTEKKEIKAEPEKVPGAVTFRKIEKWIWGVGE